MSSAGEREPFLKSPNGRFLLVLLAGEAVCAAFLLSVFFFAHGEGELKWGLYMVFGLLWLGAVLSVTLWAVYQAGWLFSRKRTTRFLVWGLGSFGALPGAFLAFAETAIVSGYPPIVLVTTPVFIVFSTCVGVVTAVVIGEGLESLLSYMRRTVR